MWKQKARSAEENAARLADEVTLLKTKLVRIAEAVKEERQQAQQDLTESEKRVQLAEERSDGLEQKLIELMAATRAQSEKHQLEIQQLQTQLKVRL